MGTIHRRSRQKAMKRHTRLIPFMALCVLSVCTSQVLACQAAPEDLQPKQEAEDNKQQLGKGRLVLASDGALPANWESVVAAIDAATKRGTFTWFGLTLQEAVEKTKASGTAMRIVEKNGRPMPVTRDYRKGRLNLRVYAGKIIGATIEGETFNEGAPVALLDYLGLSGEAAAALAKKNGVPLRTAVRDGESMPLTADMNPKRVNIRLKKDVVIGAGHG